MLFSDEKKSWKEELEYISKMAVGVLKMPICFLNNEGEIIFEYSYGYSNNPLMPDKKQLFNSLFGDIAESCIPLICSTKYNENYFGIKINNGSDAMGILIAGPSIFSDAVRENIHDLITANKIVWSISRDVIAHYNTVQVIEYSRLVDCSILLYYVLYNEKLDKNVVVERNSSFSNMDKVVQKKYKENSSKNRQNTFFHHSQIREKYLNQAIMEGDSEKLRKQLEIPMDGEMGVLSYKNPLRSEKNLSICSVVIATRAAMEGGLDSETAYTLSDSYIQQIEEINEIKDIYALMLKMYLDFTERVHITKIESCSKAVNRSKNYILKHLYEDITLDELAQNASLNPNYLCTLFKKEIGITINDYIQKERIEEGKRLLESTNYPLLDIAIWLNFHDQSHFTRVFKKITGITPKAYKNKLNQLP